MKIIIRDRNPELIAGLRNRLNGAPGLSFECGDIFIGEPAWGAEPVWGFVSPANSFGFMDGGIDRVYARKWPWIQDRVQACIAGAGGCLLPGRSLEVPISTDRDWAGPRVLIVLPTMVAPMVIAGSTNVFLAFYELVRRYLREERGHVVACPGLGTGVGGVSPREAANQMRAAYDVAMGQFPAQSSGSDLQRTFAKVFKE